MKNKNQIWAWVGVVVVIVVAVIFYMREDGAMQGNIVPGFPSELVLDASQSMTPGYSIQYPATTHQYSAVWYSSSSVEDVFADYVNYFQANGWTVNGLPITDLSRRVLSASSATGYVLLSIATEGQGSRIVVSYVNQ